MISLVANNMFQTSDINLLFFTMPIMFEQDGVLIHMGETGNYGVGRNDRVPKSTVKKTDKKKEETLSFCIYNSGSSIFY